MRRRTVIAAVLGYAVFLSVHLRQRRNDIPERAESGRWNAGQVVRAVTLAGAPLDSLEICIWCVECPDEPAEQLAVGGSPVNEQPGWHAADCPWRLAHEVFEERGRRLLVARDRRWWRP